MGENVKVTIGLPIYNAEKYLKSAINSILNQSFKNFELIITDDGSTDRSLEIIKSFNDQSIKIISDGENKGLGFRLNEQINLAEGKYFARMDADDIMFPNRILEQINYLESNPEIDVVGGWAIVIDENNKILGLRKSSVPHTFGKVLQNGIFIHPTVMGKTDWFNKNLYNPEFRGSQDYDLWIRSFKKSHFAIIEKPILFYRDPLKIHIRTYLFRQRQIRKSLEYNKLIINNKYLILKMNIYTRMKTLIYYFLVKLRLYNRLISNRNSSLTEVNKLIYKDLLLKISYYNTQAN